MDDTTSSAQEPAVTPQTPSDMNALKAQCEEYLSGWRRAQADYANLQRERERDRLDSMKYANTQLLQSLLPALDQFTIALRFLPDTKTLPETERKTWESWLVGIRAVQTLWEQAATSAGLERIPVTGTFDPMLHEAVSQESAEGLPSGSIKRVIQDGWRLHGKVLRPAQVVVVQESGQSSSSDQSS